VKKKEGSDLNVEQTSVDPDVRIELFSEREERLVWKVLGSLTRLVSGGRGETATGRPRPGIRHNLRKLDLEKGLGIGGVNPCVVVGGRTFETARTRWQ